MHHNIHWQTLKYVKYGEPIKGADKYQDTQHATSACLATPECTAVYHDFHSHKFYLMSGTTQVPHTSSSKCEVFYLKFTLKTLQNVDIWKIAKVQEIS